MLLMSFDGIILVVLVSAPESLSTLDVFGISLVLLRASKLKSFLVDVFEMFVKFDAWLEFVIPDETTCLLHVVFEATELKSFLVDVLEMFAKYDAWLEVVVITDETDGLLHDDVLALFL